MNQESIAELVIRSKAGDREALETLLTWAHTPVSYLCRTILQDPELVGQKIWEILRTLSRQLYNLDDPERFEKWVCEIAAESCMEVFYQLQDREPSSAPLHLSGKNLNRRETVGMIQQLVDRLPGDLRTVLVLYCCAGMKSQNIAEVMGITKEEARENLSRSQTILQKQIDLCMDRGIQFSEMTSLVDILHTAMYQNEEEEEARRIAWDILEIGPAAGADDKPENRGLRILLISMIVLLSLLIVLFAGLIVKHKLTPPPEVTLPTWVDTTPELPEEPEISAEAATETLPESAETEGTTSEEA